MNPFFSENEIKIINNEDRKQNLKTQIQNNKIITNNKNLINNISDPQIKYCASTSDTYRLLNQQLISYNSEEEIQNLNSTNQLLNVQIIDNTKNIFTTDLKPIKKFEIKNTFQKKKLENFYKDKLNVSIVSNSNDYYQDEISEVLLNIQKKENEINDSINKKKTEKDPEKEEMKMLFRTHSEQIIYDKLFGNFFGFICTTFKNRKKENFHKLQIQINKINKENNKKIHFFGIYDGHKGVNISKYLKENLSENILNNTQLIKNPIETIKNSFINIDKKLLNEYNNNKIKEISYEKSGSCCQILLNFDNKIYIGNLGNLRSIISSKLGKFINNLSIDHIPNEVNEKKRIEKFNGKIIEKNNIYYIYSINFPFCRSIGDFDIKTNIKNKGIIISEPDVIEIEINSYMDFILIGSSEIFKYVRNEELCKFVFYTINKGIYNNLDYKSILSNICKSIIELVIDKGAKDNLSIIILIMENLYNIILNKDNKTLEKIIKEINIKTEDCNDLFIPNKFFGVETFEKNKSIKSQIDNKVIIQNNKNNNINDNNNNKNEIQIKTKKKSFLKCLCFD